MDYLYWKLCQYIEEREYSGGTTDTAKVTVDNRDNTVNYPSPKGDGYSGWLFIKVDVLTYDILSATSSKPIKSKVVYDAFKNLLYVDYSKAQALTDEQKSQARTNIEIDHDEVVYYDNLQDDIIEELTEYEIIDPISDSSNEILLKMTM